MTRELDSHRHFRMQPHFIAADVQCREAQIILQQQGRMTCLRAEAGKNRRAPHVCASTAHVAGFSAVSLSDVRPSTTLHGWLAQRKATVEAQSVPLITEIEQYSLPRRRLGNSHGRQSAGLIAAEACHRDFFLMSLLYTVVHQIPSQRRTRNLRHIDVNSQPVLLSSNFRVIKFSSSESSEH